MESLVDIDDKTVYEFTGNPSPAFIERIMDILLSKEIGPAFQ